MGGWLRPRPGRPYLAGAPLLVAHRGGAKLAPENTLTAFRSAVDDWGADMLEMDVRLTADGRVAVIHDATVDRTTDGSGPVAELTMAELQALDAGHRFVDLDGEPSFRARGVKVPSMEEVLEACPSVWINVEAKEAAVAGPLAELLRSMGESYRVLVAAELEKSRADARGYDGPWGASRRHCLLFWILHHLPGGGPYTPPADALQIPEFWKGARVLTPRLVEQAHRRNLPLHVWTVDDPDDMRRMIDWGVDGIQTDRPDLLSEVLVEMAGRPLPPCRRGGEASADPRPVADPPSPADPRPSGDSRATADSRPAPGPDPDPPADGRSGA